ncbi:sensor histidine kinase [Ornithinimicrobium avium]|uniref:histidine kinase n=1 Tax=Ornithinimicrobium avium TaxID=2283195 RepID=A0A345NN20_9MICO|nr:histidine kinase [Ornithinimicrobium avium]AXH96428.1 hypothetical protein DV701_10130 [Ornithinimicrobium avium]
MTARTAPLDADPVPGRSLLRRATFVLFTLGALLLDALMTVPPAADLEHGHHFTAFGVWHTSVGTFVALMALAYAVLLLRRRLPLAVLAYTGALSVLLTFTHEWSQPLTGALVCTFTAASLAATRRTARVALALALAATLTTSVISMGRLDLGTLFPIALVGTVTWAVWLFGRREHLARVTAAGLRDRLEEHGEEAALQERRRIARELHDILAHSVSAMMMQAAGAKAITHGARLDAPDDPRLETVERALSTIENTGSQSMRELHRLLGALRGDDAEPDRSDVTSSHPGLADVERLAELTRQSGLVVELRSSGDVVRLDPSVGLAAYRVVQEALANAMKHSGRGGVVEVFHTWLPDRLQLQVRTRDGHEGTLQTVHSSGTGLLGLRERVELMGGTFESGIVGEEFVTTAVLPLTPVPYGARVGGGG